MWIKSTVRPELDGTTGETTSHLTRAARCHVIGYSHSTKPASGQVAGYVEGYVLAINSYRFIPIMVRQAHHERNKSELY